MMTFSKLNPITGRRVTRALDISREQYDAWLAGTLIQDAFPNLSPAEREFIKTGIAPDDWAELFGEPDWY